MACQWKLLDSEFSGHFSRFARSVAANKPAFDKMETLVSDACPKKYIFFDRSGGKERVIVHPELMQRVNDMPNEIGSQTQHKLQSGCHLNAQALEGLKSMFDRIESMQQVNRKTSSRESAVAASADDQVTPNTTSEFCPLAPRLSFERPNQVWSNQSTMGDEDGDLGSILHEDTADLDAFLESDEDESSTAHSPSDITCMDGTGDGGTTRSNEYTSKIEANPCIFESEEEPEVSSFFQELPPTANLHNSTFSENYQSSSFSSEESDCSCSNKRKRNPAPRQKFLRVRNPGMKFSSRRRDPRGKESPGVGSPDNRSRQNKPKTKILDNVLEPILPSMLGKTDPEHVAIRDEKIDCGRSLQKKLLELGSTRAMQAIMNNEDTDTKSTQDSESCGALSESILHSNSLSQK